MTEKQINAVVIGTSAGGVDALSALLPRLPAGYAPPVFVVIHLPPDRDSVIAELMAEKSVLPVYEAEDKEPIRPGTVYFAPPDYHLLVEDHETLSLSVEMPVHYSRPSIDVLFETAADVFGDGLVGIVLTGANNDGAEGLRKIGACGGAMLVQDPKTAFSAAMPDAALKLNPRAQCLSIAQIADYLVKGHSGHAL